MKIGLYISFDSYVFFVVVVVISTWIKYLTFNHKLQQEI